MIDEIKKLLNNPINEIISGIGSEFKQITSNRLLEHQAENYNSNYFTKTFLQRKDPVPLESIYIPLTINRGNKEYQKYNREFSVSSLFNTTTKNGKEINRKRITIVGSAGSGKSTLIKFLYVNSIESKFKYPIKIELRNLNDSELSFTEYVFNNIFKYESLGKNESIIARMLSSDKFLFFLDGLDEISSIKRHQLMFEINEFVKRYNKNYFILTSRPYTSANSFQNFKTVFVSDLSDSQINKFIKKQLPKSEQKIADKIIEEIWKKENKDYRYFLKNPLLLAMFILTYQNYANIPPKKSEFYTQVFETLYHIHDSFSKLAFVREKISGLNKEQFRETLKLFSFISFFQEKYLFDELYINKTLKTIKKNVHDLDFDNSKLIEDLQVSIALLTKDGLYYTFPHRSIQEYFAALYISEISSLENKKALYRKFLKNNTLNNEQPDELHNFFQLLNEMDYTNFNKILILPFFERVLAKMKQNITYKNYKDYIKLVEESYKFVSYLGLEAFKKLSKRHNRIIKNQETHKEVVIHKEIPMFFAEFTRLGSIHVEKLQRNIKGKERSEQTIIQFI